MGSRHLTVVEELQRRRLMLPSIEDVVNAFAAMSAQDWSVLAGCATWVVLLCLPLRGIDRRDRVAGATYAMWLAAAGIVMILAVPGKWHPERFANARLWLIVGLSSVAFLRWVLRRRVVLEVPSFKEKQ